MEHLPCEKVLLADSLGIKLQYCKKCEVVELELGAVSIRLSPDSIQRIANIMMKASLKLDKANQHVQSHAEPQLLH
ncbi:MAG: hypothetical protein SFU55_11140 [Methylophilus sp.]|nr:hypothetical protein [Methylophilus sp.]